MKTLILKASVLTALLVIVLAVRTYANTPPAEGAEFTSIQVGSVMGAGYVLVPVTFSNVANFAGFKLVLKTTHPSTAVITGIVPHVEGLWASHPTESGWLVAFTDIYERVGRGDEVLFSLQVAVKSGFSRIVLAAAPRIDDDNGSAMALRFIPGTVRSIPSVLQALLCQLVQRYPDRFNIVCDEEGSVHMRD